MFGREPHPVSEFIEYEDGNSTKTTDDGSGQSKHGTPPFAKVRVRAPRYLISPQRLDRYHPARRGSLTDLISKPALRFCTRDESLSMPPDLPMPVRRGEMTLRSPGRAASAAMGAKRFSISAETPPSAPIKSWCEPSTNRGVAGCQISGRHLTSPHAGVEHVDRIGGIERGSDLISTLLASKLADFRWFHVRGGPAQWVPS